MSSSAWFHNRRKGLRTRARLLCFPFAGGGGSTYASWQSYVPAELEVMAVQLPGRGSRFQEPPYTDMDTLIADLLPAVRNRIDCPTALFGHSMGALIAYELAKRMTAEGTPPSGLYVSGAAAPQYRHADPEIPGLPKAELIERLKKLNGAPKHIFENHELLELVLPTIRADFHLTARYTHRENVILTCPVEAFCGEQDPEVLPETMMLWQKTTTGEFSLRRYPGDHFFLNAVGQQIATLISRSLLEQVQIRSSAYGV